MGRVDGGRVFGEDGGGSLQIKDAERVARCCGDTQSVAASPNLRRHYPTNKLTVDKVAGISPLAPPPPTPTTAN